MCLQEMEDGHASDGGDWATLDYERVHRITAVQSRVQGAREAAARPGSLEERRTGFPAQTHFRESVSIKQLLIELSRSYNPQSTARKAQCWTTCTGA